MDGGDYPFVTRAAAFASDVFQHALVDAYVVTALLARMLLHAAASPCRWSSHCSALGRPITAKDRDEICAFDEFDHSLGRRCTPEEGTPDPQQNREGELDNVPDLENRTNEGGGYMMGLSSHHAFGLTAGKCSFSSFALVLTTSRYTQFTCFLYLAGLGRPRLKN